MASSIRKQFLLIILEWLCPTQKSFRLGAFLRPSFSQNVLLGLSPFSKIQHLRLSVVHLTTTATLVNKSMYAHRFSFFCRVTPLRETIVASCLFLAVKVLQNSDQKSMLPLRRNLNQARADSVKVMSAKSLHFTSSSTW